MNNGSLRVRTFRSGSGRSGSGWSYAVCNLAGQTLVSRRGYASDAAARAAGHAAADALAPVDAPSRYAYLPEPEQGPSKSRNEIAGWRTLIR